MKELLTTLTLKEDRTKLSTLFLLMMVAYLVSIAVRFIWVDQMTGNDSALWNDQLMINTNDGYMYAEGARDLLAGGHQENDLSRVNVPLSQLTYLLAKILPFSFESIILYMPAVFGSLLVLPVLLVGRAIGQTYLGFFAALVASIVWSYYNRTMTGYYDSDMLIIVLPVLVLWSLILGVTHNKNRYLLITTATILLYNFWYPASYSLNVAMASMLLIYTIIFDRKNLFNYKLLLFMAIAIAKIPIVAQIGLSVGLFVLFHWLKERADRSVVPLLGVGIAAVVLTGGIAPILGQLSSYVFRSEVSSGATAATLHYFNVVQTVREAGDIPFEVFADRISGSVLVFVLSTIGYLLMAIRYPVMLIALPLLGLGFMAYTGGLRFTIYAVPVNALGIAFLILLMTKWVITFFGESKQRVVGILFGLLATSAALYPNIQHIIDYRVPTVFNRDEVVVLDELKKRSAREDYVLAWWDYGYPIRYYSDVKTLVDGGKHSGNVNFPVSYALTFPQTEAANMARLITEYTEMQFKKSRGADYLQSMMEDYGFQDPNEFLEQLKTKDLNLPEKTREVFFYLPFRMMSIYQTVRLFSNLDLTTGSQFAQPFLFVSNAFRDTGDKIVLDQGIEIDKRKSIIKIGQQELPLNSLFVTVYDNQGKLRKQQQKFNPSAHISVIFMKSYNKFIVLDQQTLASTYFQLFVLENYDPELFEPVILSPIAKVYRLKK